MIQALPLFIALVIDPPSVIAAAAIPVPTMARIKAYSAADAPLSSNTKDLMNFAISISSS